MPYRRSKQGFTLIELAIVIVILGLLVGGVLIAQSIIEAAKVNKLGKQTDEYRTAITAFKVKYNALPGDMGNATRFWGEVAPGCSNQQGTGTQTCDGNNNSKVGDAITGENYEIFRFWQHLANAGLISGEYTGVEGPGSNRDSLAGVNVPSVTYSQSVGFSILTIDLATAMTFPTYYFSTLAGTSFTIGGELASYEAFELLAPFLSGLEASNIDVKFDDGKAGLGRMFGSPNSSAFAVQCTTTDDPNTAEYSKLDEIKRCHLNAKIF